VPRSYHLILLTLLLLLAAAGRIYHLGQQSIWEDEAFTYYAVTQPNMIDIVVKDVHPPLYFLGMAMWVPLTGTSEVALRYFSVLPAMLSVAMIYQLAKEVARSTGRQIEVVALLAALLMALSDAEISLSQEVRMYTWHVLWACVSVWGFLRWSRTNERWALITWFLGTLALIYTHYLGVFIPFVQGLYALIFLRGRMRITAIGVLSACGVLFAPWLFGVTLQQPRNAAGNFYEGTNWLTVLDMRQKWFGDQWAVMLMLALVGLVRIVPSLGPRYKIPNQAARFWQRQDFQQRFGMPFLLLAWFLVPIVIVFILNLFMPILLTYRLSQITPSVVLLTALGLANFRWPERGWLVAAILVYSVTTVDFYRPKPPWREIAQKAAQYARPGQLALSELGGPDYHVLYYFDRLMPPGTKNYSMRMWRRNDPSSYPTGLPDVLDDYATVWVEDWSAEEDLYVKLEATGHVRTATMTTDHLGNAIDVYRYDRLPDKPVTIFENGMILRQIDFDAQKMRLDLWWMSETVQTNDYTVSAFLLNESGQLVAQLDSYPFNGERPTSSWQAGENIYDPHILAAAQGFPIPSDLPAGRYQLGVKVYLSTTEGLTIIKDSEEQEYRIVGEMEK